MRLNMLGSGGVNPPPRATSFTPINEEARAKGIPYARTGCSLFVHEANLLFDTPEEIRAQLNRERIPAVDHVILTHWHPDHTHGLRVLEQINWDFAHSRPYHAPIPVHISQWQWDMLREKSCGSFLDFYAKRGMITVELIEHRKPIRIGALTVTPYIIEHTKGFSFLLDDGGPKVLYTPCEYHHVIPDPEVTDVEDFIVHNLFWENPAVSPRENPPTDEDSFEQMLEHAKAFGAKRIVLTHIEESFGLNHDELNARMRQFYPEWNIVAGYDGMIIDHPTST